MYSAKVRIRTDYVQNDGRSAIFLDVRLGAGSELRQKLPLKLFWPLPHFDKAAGICLPRHRDDADCEAANLVLGQKLGRAAEIFTEYRLRRQPLTLERFVHEFDNPMSKTDFLLYYEQKLDERLRLRIIVQSTYDVQRRSLARIREFAGGLLPFHRFDRTWATRYDTWLTQVQSNGINTRWARHKDVTTYLHLAQLDEISFINPYDYFQKKTVEGSWRPVSPNTVKQLLAYYELCRPGTPERQTLQKYLTACCANLRISDLNRAKQHNLMGDELVYVQHKNRRFGHIHRLPLTPMAQRLIADSLRENGQRERLFADQTAQAGNRILKRIAARLEITERLHFHSGRETFGTEFIANGGQLPVLQKLMGHSKIASTMRYVHVREQQKKEQVILVDKMFE